MEVDCMMEIDDVDDLRHTSMFVNIYNIQNVLYISVLLLYSKLYAKF